MKQQVLMIHGGTSFDTYDEYIDFIKTRELTKDRLIHCADWRFFLSKDLGGAFEVFVPGMPNGTNARYSEWCIWFQRCASLLEDDAILIGHSLGGIFLAKYLSEHSFPKKIKASIFVAAPFDTTSTVESLKDFALPDSLAMLEKQGGKLHFIHSNDDPIVPVQEVKKYQDALPTVHVMLLDGKGHFRQESFPELVELIQSL